MDKLAFINLWPETPVVEPRVVRPQVCKHIVHLKDDKNFETPGGYDVHAVGRQTIVYIKFATRTVLVRRKFDGKLFRFDSETAFTYASRPQKYLIEGVSTENSVDVMANYLIKHLT